MLLRLPHEQVKALALAVARGGVREVGGQLFGEQLAPSQFRATRITVQQRKGTLSRFAVDLFQAARDAMQFFAQTKRDFRRFNYIGEWHSHPLFEVRPSSEDVATMRALVRSRDFAGTFAILIIARLDAGALQCGGWLFDPDGNEMNVTLEFES